MKTQKLYLFLAIALLATAQDLNAMAGAKKFARKVLFSKAGALAGVCTTALSARITYNNEQSKIEQLKQQIKQIEQLRQIKKTEHIKHIEQIKQQIKLLQCKTDLTKFEFESQKYIYELKKDYPNSRTGKVIKS